MTPIGVVQVLVFAGIVAAIAKPVGLFLAAVFEGRRTWLHPMLRPLERAIYRVAGVDENVEQPWTRYAGALLAFTAVKVGLTVAILECQGMLPFNPQGFGTAHAAAGSTPMTLDLAFNTAISFVTNTNWQAYGGETTLSYFSQMVALAVQNFTSAAAGMAVAMAVIRGFSRRESPTLGNFWTDVTRATVYVLLPLAFVVALVFASQGVVQNWDPYTHATTLEGASQVIAQGPVASQEAIKVIGTNGGGFFNANSAHPFENPTPFTSYLQVVLIFAIGAGLTYTFGHMVRDTRQGWSLLAAMGALFLVGVLVLYGAEQGGTPLLARVGVDRTAAFGQPGGNMEGKEVRFGIVQSALFATVTTDASCGAVNAMHESLTPIGGLVPLFNIQTGEVIIGGVGSGLYGMLLFAILAVFIAGLMVGRTPEYVGKKIEQREVKMAMLALIATAFSILLFTALGAAVPLAKGGYWNPPGPAFANAANGGPHALSSMLYAYSSATGNNGSAFAGLAANTPWYNVTTALAMLVGRFLFLLPLLAAAGSLAAKKVVPVTAGTLPTHGGLFVGLLVGTVVIVGALTFFPVLSLGPIVEHFLMNQGRLFSWSLPVQVLPWL
jgi:potassium-transporting ATPase potassium-binding subunit